MNYTEKIKLALNYAEESATRCRWIVFILQLSVVLVMAAIWQQEEMNWATLRLTAAQSLVRVLTCQPEQIYGSKAAQIALKPPKDATASSIGAEYVDAQYRCNVGFTSQELSQARAYYKSWQFSLAEAKKNVADLQQLMFTRNLAINVPVLGIAFDVNDVSVVAGITFSILLGWFNFALHRQYKNVNKIFDMAREGGADREPDRIKRLRTTYRLLAMSQVLTVPPATDRDLHVSLLRRILRPSSFIMWTAVLAQILAVIEDFRTMFLGEVLSKLLTWMETGLAVALLLVSVYWTCQCFRKMDQTYKLWEVAYEEFTKEVPETNQLAHSAAAAGL